MPLPIHQFPFTDLLEKERILAFERQFGGSAGHWAMAGHAAFASVLSADLAQQIWLNFRNLGATDGSNRPIEPVAVADVLLSGLVQPIDRDRFQFYPEVRLFLLDLLKNDTFWKENDLESFGPARLDQLADFLKKYASQRLSANDSGTTLFRESLEWAADGWLEPARLLSKLQQALADSVGQQNAQAQVRIGLALQRLDRQYDFALQTEGSTARPAGFDDLLSYGNGLRSHHFGQPIERTKALFEKLAHRVETPEMASTGGWRLPIPKEIWGKLPVAEAEKQPNRGKVRAILMACSHYSDGTANLHGANDCRAMAEFLNANFEVASTKILLDQSATLQNLLDSSFDAARQSDPNDTLIFFLSLDGRKDDRDFSWIFSETDGVDYLFWKQFQSFIQSALGEKPAPRIIFFEELEPPATGFPQFISLATAGEAIEIDGQFREEFTWGLLRILEDEPRMPFGRLAAGLRQLFWSKGKRMPVLRCGPDGFRQNLGPFAPDSTKIWQERLLSINEFDGSVNGIFSEPLKIALEKNGLNGLSSAEMEAHWEIVKADFLKKMAERPVLVFVFSNLGDTRLPGLDTERAAIEVLQKQTAGLVEILILNEPTRFEINGIFNSPEFRQRIVAFHYAGPESFTLSKNPRTAGIGQTREAIFQETENILRGLVLSDGAGERDLFQWLEWGELLRWQSNFRLLFINSCYGTFDLGYLQQMGVPVVVAAAGVMDDLYATEAAGKIWQLLLDDKTIQEANDISRALLSRKFNGTKLDWFASDWSELLKGYKIPYERYEKKVARWLVENRLEEALDWLVKFNLPNGRWLELQRDFQKMKAVFDSHTQAKGGARISFLIKDFLGHSNRLTNNTLVEMDSRTAYFSEKKKTAKIEPATISTWKKLLSDYRMDAIFNADFERFEWLEFIHFHAQFHRIRQLQNSGFHFNREEIEVAEDRFMHSFLEWLRLDFPDSKISPKPQPSIELIERLKKLTANGDLQMALSFAIELYDTDELLIMLAQLNRLHMEDKTDIHRESFRKEENRISSWLVEFVNERIQFIDKFNKPQNRFSLFSETRKLISENRLDEAIETMRPYVDSVELASCEKAFSSVKALSKVDFSSIEGKKFNLVEYQEKVADMLLRVLEMEEQKPPAARKK